MFFTACLILTGSDLLEGLISLGIRESTATDRMSKKTSGHT
jgi:hypothetical protein